MILKSPIIRNLSKADFDFSKMYEGLISAPLEAVKQLDSDAIKAIIATCPIYAKDMNNYVYDTKVHMLMPNQWPCIPNWHCDFVPRVPGNKNYVAGELDYGKVNTDKKIFMWVSGNPVTQFINKEVETPLLKTHGEISEYLEEGDYFSIPAQTWVQFDQLTPHRGTKAKEFSWRLFIRVAHKDLNKPKAYPDYIRRHTQVYLDSNEFTW